MKLILNPSDLARMRCGLVHGACFGGGSKSQAVNTSAQSYYDSRQTNQTDNHAVSDSNNVSEWLSNVGNTSTTVEANRSYSTQDSGNTWSQESTAVTDSGNTSSTWWQANSDSHAVANSGNTSSQLTRNTSTADSGNVSDTGNVFDSRSTVTNYTGTDGGAVTIAGFNSQLLQALGDSNNATVRSLATLGANVGNSSADLAMASQANSMQLSSHMLDLTGELIDRLATGASVTTAAQTAMVKSTAGAASDSTKQMQKMAYIAGGVLVLAIVLKGK